MDIAIWIFTIIVTFIITEFTAWFNHKYIMHGPLWILHKDHHKKDHKSWFERNDLFFFFYAFLSFSFVVLWGQGFWLGLPIAIGIWLYGLAYFIVHDIFIHQRSKFFKKSSIKYLQALRKAHKIHHKNIHKDHGENFGMLFFPLKYWK